jgi:hypothetical protein
VTESCSSFWESEVKIPVSEDRFGRVHRRMGWNLQRMMDRVREKQVIVSPSSDKGKIRVRYTIHYLTTLINPYLILRSLISHYRAIGTSRARLYE